MKLLELFSGTHSIGKVAKKKFNINVTSLDKDIGAECPFGSSYRSDKHIKADIMHWDYTEFDKDEFDIITASPVCFWWSNLRYSHIGRGTTREQIEKERDLYGKPMIDKLFEILNYFQPRWWWIENPQTGALKYYISQKYSEFDTFYDVDYCQYTDWGYKKRTRIWTNILDFEPKLCKSKNHSKAIGRTSNFRHRKIYNYRVPFKIIEELLLLIY